jgi:EAL domain-containing protein (putative c-di-GMP-specific phosphodiesterase class I)
MLTEREKMHGVEFARSDFVTEDSRLDLELIAEEASSDLAATASESVPWLDVPRILKGDSIQMAFQPIVNLGSRESIGYEALARFPEEEIVSPQGWFAAAAAQGLEEELEILAVASALSQLDDLPAGAFVSLNVSPATAGSPSVRDLIDVEQRARVIFEIKEDAAIEDYQRFTGVIDELRATGVRIAVDDAGLADVSLRHMLDIRPDFIKIDTDVTRGVDHDPVKQAIVMAFRSLAAQAGALSLAEGIETEEELETLRSLNIDLGQGYLLGRPAYLDKVPKHRKRRRPSTT